MKNLLIIVLIHYLDDEYERVSDLVVTLGGDGSLLHVSSLFPAHVPPVLTFSMGTMGFLMPFG